MKAILSDKSHAYFSDEIRLFLTDFDKEICSLGFQGAKIGDFNRWGNDTMAYIKPNVKAKVYISKILFDGISVNLRIYLRNIDKHINFIENSPKHILDSFINEIGKCDHCSVGGCVKPDGSCSHRKTYAICGVTYEKCDGKVFFFPNFFKYPVSDYIALIKEFYCTK